MEILNQPFQLTNSDGNENSFFTFSGYNYSSLGCWEYDGSIIVSEFINSGDTLQFIQSILSISEIVMIPYVHPIMLPGEK